MTIQVNLAEAKAKLSALIDAAGRGENVIIARNGEPVAELRSLAARPQRRLGVLKDYGWTWDAPYEAFEPDPADAEMSPLDPDDPES